MAVGAQHVYWEASGAYTGEISVPMLAGLATYAIAGHSERRQLFGETDLDVQRKTLAILAGRANADRGRRRVAGSARRRADS